MAICKACVQVSDLVKDICRSLKKQNAAGMPDMYLQAMQNAFQRHLDDQGQGTLQEFAALCARVAQTYAGFNTSATALLHIAKVPKATCMFQMVVYSASAALCCEVHACEHFSCHILL